MCIWEFSKIIHMYSQKSLSVKLQQNLQFDTSSSLGTSITKKKKKKVLSKYKYLGIS